MNAENKKLDLRIIIAAMNSEQLLKHCLNSIIENTRKINYEIVVIDNGSKDNTIEMLRQNFPQVKVIGNSKNMGVAPSRNQGLQNNGARYALILDADTTVQPEALDKMVQFMDEHESIGICGSRLESPDGELQLTCRRFHNILIPFLRRLTFLSVVRNSYFLNRFLMEDYNHKNPKKVDHVIGACQMIRKDLIEKIGLLDDRMFYGWEDTDYCVHRKKAGYDTWYYPYATIVHHEQRVTKRRMFNRLFFENIKSMILFFGKYPSGLIGKY